MKAKGAKRKRKIIIEQRQFKRMTQMCAFAEANRNRFPADSQAAAALPELVTSVGEVTDLVARLASVGNRMRELTFAVTTAKGALLRSMECLYYTAGAIATEVPGFDGQFRLALNSEPRLLTAGLSAVNDAAPHAELFIKYAMPPNFLDVLKDNVQKFQQACDALKAGRRVPVGR